MKVNSQKSWKVKKVRKFEWHEANTRRPWKLSTRTCLVSSIWIWKKTFASSLSQQFGRHWLTNVLGMKEK